MAYRGVIGVPGSGKSYYMVHWLATNFCVELKRGGYALDPSKNVRVITNIAGLQLPHEDFQTALDDAGGFEQFFTKEYQSFFSRGSHLIYIFDEAQEWFHPRFCKLTIENILYFTWARHEGHDIFFLSQNEKLIIYDLACLSEYIVYAQPRVNNIANELTYIYRTFDGTEIRSERILFNKKIAALYKSAEKGEVVKIKNYRIRKLFAALVVSLVLMIYGFRGTLEQWHKFMGGGDGVQKSSASAPSAAKSANAAAIAPASASKSASPASPSPPTTFSLSDSSPKSEPQVEYYMYRLDHAVSGITVKFLLGTVWLPMKEFPYRVIKKGSNYFAMIPAVLLPALENGARALPIRTDKNKG